MAARRAASGFFCKLARAPAGRRLAGRAHRRSASTGARSGRCSRRHSYLNAQFQRLRARRGPRKAICAVAASILTGACHMLGDGTSYADPGPHLFRRTEATTRAKPLARQIERLGFTCSISPGEPVSI